MRFLDHAKIWVKAGDGGDGCISFRREKFIEFGGPDGGKGGNGGDVIARCVSNLDTLMRYRYQKHFKAKKGVHGMGRNRTGANGAPVFIDLPVGTQIFDDDTDVLLADMVAIDQEVLIKGGGSGGFGNYHFKTSTNRAPRRANSGTAGEEGFIRLELKVLADVGLLGLPNAGKSTLLSRVSAARPKIADYPFTTLHPELGVIDYGDDHTFVMADMPGLIEGASEGQGLGHRFLGHVERCVHLVHLVDGTSEDPVRDCDIVREEVSRHGKALSDKPVIYALSKCDALTAEDAEAKRQSLSDRLHQEVVLVSSHSGHGLDSLIHRLGIYIQARRESEKTASSDMPWSPI